MEQFVRGERISQRKLAERLNISVALLNRCVRELERRGYVRVADRQVRPFLYQLTPEGESFRLTETYHRHNWIVVRFTRLERRVRARMAKLKADGVNTIVCYGAGEILLLAQRCAESIGLQVIGAVDDDQAKHYVVTNGFQIQPPSALDTLQPDAVLLTNTGGNAPGARASSNHGRPYVLYEL